MFNRKINELIEWIESLQHSFVSTIWLHLTRPAKPGTPALMVRDLVEKNEYKALLWGMAESAGRLLALREPHVAAALIKVLGDNDYYGRCAIAGEDPRYLEWRSRGAAAAIAIIHRRESPRDTFLPLADALCDSAKDENKEED